MTEASRSTETIYLAGGCFWCTEAVFTRVEGVERVQSGYANGHVPSPTYEQVCEGTTGHAEAIEVVFDPQRVKVESLLEVFFGTHDPTTLNRQGNDVGTQYRSGIYTTSADQHTRVLKFVEQLKSSHAFAQPVVTEVEPLQAWWPAEGYHDDYFARNPRQPYCAYVVAPKVDKFNTYYSHLAKSSG